ncbi:MAG: hypothetical protein ACYDA8_11730 [Deferrisomatales bacterium]
MDGTLARRLSGSLNPFTFNAALWDSSPQVAAQVAGALWVGVRGKMVECLSLLRDLLGYPDFTPDDPELSAFAYAVAHACVASSQVPRDRAGLLLQRIAVHLYYKQAPGARGEALAYWNTLNEARVSFRNAAREAPGKSRFLAMLGQFFAAYGLGGSDHLDIHFGLYRALVPCVSEVLELLNSPS